jgi:NADH-quinone oxidoreductase subunit L
MQNNFVWLIFLIPFLSFLVVSLILKPFFKDKPKLAGYITIAAVATSLILSVIVNIKLLGTENHVLEVQQIDWIVFGNNITWHLGLLIDSLTGIMLMVVTIVSLMVQIYSQGYMKGDTGYHRYYAAMSLFTTAMLGLVMADSLLLAFMFWEMVGLCSYLLIGFWFHKPSAANAAKKAFIVTRIGDFGFLAAIILLYSHTGTFNINELKGLAIAGTLAGTTLTWAALGIFAGAMGKSAQFPLHVWLPDAMEGPTPVSALIHAATMAAAGVFLVARTYPLFANSPTALHWVAIVGAFTAIFAASIGLVQNDIKRVLAYSTISQLGYMMVGLATGGVAVGIFHLFNHAFFKALLFLGAGSINHATNTFDMREMGGLRKAMPKTYLTFLIGAISLAGIWPLSGFWSKDAILTSAVDKEPVLAILVLITVFMTAFYMFRVIFLTFGGTYRGKEHHLHESSSVMTVPLFVLAVLAVGSGFLNLNGGFNSFFGAGETHSIIEGLFGIFKEPLPWISLVLAGSGIFLAYAIYSKKWLSAENIGRIFQPLYKVFYNKYWMDQLYENIIVKKLLMGGLFKASYWFDSKIIDGGLNTFIIQKVIAKNFFTGLSLFDRKGVDGAVNGVAGGTVAAGKTVRKAQTGQLQFYGLIIGLGILALIVSVFIFSRV